MTESKITLGKNKKKKKVHSGWYILQWSRVQNRDKNIRYLITTSSNRPTETQEAWTGHTWNGYSF